MYMKLKDGKSKVLTFSYDDGVVQDIRLIELFNKYGLKGTFNINSGAYFPEDGVREKFYGRMKLSEAKELYTNSGHEVAVHSLSHPFLNKVKSDEVIYEVIEDRKNIEKQYGVITRGMAYPMGPYNKNVVECLEKLGIAYARTTVATDKFEFPENWLEWHPTCHHKNPDLMALADKFVNETPKYLCDNRLFYVWGHSYEFDQKDNWHVIEQFCEYVSGKDDIWYATNIEIYDYVMAYNNLQTSVDKTVIHNPSAIDVWFSDNKKRIHCVKAGETLKI